MLSDTYLEKMAEEVRELQSKLGLKEFRAISRVVVKHSHAIPDSNLQMEAERLGIILKHFKPLQEVPNES